MIKQSMLQQYFNMQSQDFASYLAGLIENDGHINAKQIIIIFNGAHFVGVQKLSSVLGGSIAKGKTTYSWRYVLAHKAGLSYVLKLTSKQWIGPFKTDQIKKHGLDQKYGLLLQHKALILNTCWLAGFTDADGCFNVSIRACKTSRLKQRVELRLTYSQTNAFLLHQIKNCFGVVGLGKDKNNKACRIQILGQKRLQQSVVPYFDRYKPCVKVLQYDLWREALSLVLLKKHLTVTGLNQIKHLKAQLTVFKKPLE